MKRVCAFNVLAWFAIFQARGGHGIGIWCSLTYVLACAFRCSMPRDVVRNVALIDSKLSAVGIGRTVATVGEVAFAVQLGTALDLPILAVLLSIAQCWCWCSVFSGRFIFNCVEQTHWAVAACIVAYNGGQPGVRFAAVLFLLYLISVDIPQYYELHVEQARAAKGVTTVRAEAPPPRCFNADVLLRIFSTPAVITDDIRVWRTELFWMTAYFGTAVWCSLLLAFIA